ncbi:MAG: DUF4476 domain-containing protein [Myxococcota bacterium]
MATVQGTSAIQSVSSQPVAVHAVAGNAALNAQPTPAMVVASAADLSAAGRMVAGEQNAIIKVHVLGRPHTHRGGRPIPRYPVPRYPVPRYPRPMPIPIPVPVPGPGRYPTVSALIYGLRVQPNDGARYALLGNNAGYHSFWVSEAREVLSTFHDENMRLAALRQLAPRIVDRRNQYSLADSFFWPQNKAEALATLARFPY